MLKGAKFTDIYNSLLPFDCTISIAYLTQLFKKVKFRGYKTCDIVAMSEHL